jgi:hypothetical protein
MELNPRDLYFYSFNVYPDFEILEDTKIVKIKN